MKIPTFLNKVPFRGYLLTCLAINLLVVAAVIFLLNILPPVVPLFYGLAQGEEQLAPSWALCLPALISAVIVVGNSFLSTLIEDDFQRKIILATAIGATLFSTVTTIKIILLVGSF